MRVRFEKVGKRFGPHQALRDVDLTVEPGECMVLLGPSGCGKTTLLRLLAGLESVDEGRLWIGERLVNDVPPAERDVAMVFQNYALYPHFTVFENIAFPLRARRTAEAETAPRVREAARRLELEGLLDRKPGQLSGGQQQRVALARAIVRRPAVCLMDEPLSNLDAQLRVQTRAELKRLQQELGTTTLYVTHDQAEAMTIGKRVALLRGGVLQQVGAPLELYRRPADRFVASFLGSPAINLWPAVLEEGGLTVLGLRVEVEAGRLPSPGPGRAVEAGVRPEDVRVSLVPRPGVAGRVLVTEPMGNETILTMDVAGARVVARVAAEVEASPGGTVWVSLDPRRVLLFDAAGGRLLA
ncbi:MAG TPA: ABC transporter ATP-binding protein [Vicinamibacteria bacterium]|jgi:ABC-type sugar transport system ATPase subunit